MHVPNLHSPKEDTFAIISDLVPTGDQPQAIDELTAGLLRGEKYQTLLGATGSGKTFTIAHWDYPDFKIVLYSLWILPDLSKGS